MFFWNYVSSHFLNSYLSSFFFSFFFNNTYQDTQLNKNVMIIKKNQIIEYQTALGSQFNLDSAFLMFLVYLESVMVLQFL